MPFTWVDNGPSELERLHHMDLSRGSVAILIQLNLVRPLSFKALLEPDDCQIMTIIGQPIQCALPSPVGLPLPSRCQQQQLACGGPLLPLRLWFRIQARRCPTPHPRPSPPATSSADGWSVPIRLLHMTRSIYGSGSGPTFRTIIRRYWSFPAPRWSAVGGGVSVV
jgi:hypothetical protein